MNYNSDYYSILGIHHDATNQQIRIAYRKLSKKMHPDVNNDDPFFEEFTQKINEAYFILSNPEKRKEYDAQREQQIVQKYKNTIKELRNKVLKYQEENNNLTKQLEKIVKNKHEKSTSNTVLLSLTSIFLAIVLIITIKLKNESDYKYEHNIKILKSAKIENQKLKSIINSTKTEASSIKKTINSISEYQPIIIKKIDFANSAFPNNFTNRFQYNKVKYILPRLHIISTVQTLKEITIFVDIYDSYGILSRNSKISPLQHTYKSEIRINPSSSILFLEGWGNSEGGAYQVGEYEVKIWINDKIVGESNFVIY